VAVTSVMSGSYFGGIEGGATHSKLVLCDKNGTVVARVSGPGTNHWVVGIPEVARRIAKMVEEAKKQASLEQAHQLKSLGLSLSGCEQEATNRTLENELRQHHPNIAETYYVCSDTIGSVFTANPLGGLVLIAGTGSNALLRNPDGTAYSCGGWGNFLADEGSAWWISHRAMKTVFDDEDNLNNAPHETSVVWQKIKEHFNVQTRHDLLDHCYAKFDKAFYASLCAKLSQAAEEGDPLSKNLFEEAGRYLAKATLALLPKVSKDLIVDGSFNVVCVGSVWKSWHLLQNGYTKEISKRNFAYGLNLVHLTEAMAVGATYLAADAINYNLPRDYSKNFEIFHHYGNSCDNEYNITAKLQNNLASANYLSNGCSEMDQTKHV